MTFFLLPAIRIQKLQPPVGTWRQQPGLCRLYRRTSRTFYCWNPFPSKKEV